MTKQCTYDELVTKVQSLEKEIQDRIRKEARLKEEHNILNVYLNTSEAMVVVLDINAQITLINKKGCTMLGYDNPSDVIGLNWIDHFIPPHLALSIKSVFLQIISGDLAPVEFFENSILDKNGHERIMSWHNAILKDSTGKIAGILSSGEDITQRKQTEENLIESENKYQALINASDEGILVADVHSLQLMEANPAMCRFLGYDKEELLNMKVLDIHPSDRLEYVLSVFMDQAQGKYKLGQDVPCLRKDGRVVFADIVANKAVIQGNECNIGLFRDVTERKDLESKLSHALKMEALGTLASGIAHDFNNHLMGIQGCTSLILMQTNADSVFHQHLKKMETYIQSAASLTKQLLDMGKREVLTKDSVDINVLIKNSIQFFSRTQKQLEITLNLFSEELVVEINPSQIEQVLLNLFVNAGQAVSKSGDLHIQTQMTSLKPYQVDPFRIPPGNYVKITITDTGCGIPNEIQDRIFEPFFTTRQPTGGTGLGLATAYSIIKNHQGIILVESEINRGSTFTIFLPKSSKNIKNAREMLPQAVGGTETILLIDDEEMIRDVCQRMLEFLGYSTIIATSGQDAIKAYEKNQNRISLIILDMVMPGMDGNATYDHLKKINPDLKVLLLSGYDADDHVRDLINNEGLDFLQKPFQIEALSRKLRDLLD